MRRLKENFISLYTIVRREIVRFCRIWSQTLLPPVISMSLYFIIFGNLIGNRIGTMEGVSYMQYIVPGLIMMAIITNAYGNVVASFFGSKFQKNIEELLVSPTPSSIILWGYVLGGVARGLAVGILVTITSLFFSPLALSHFFTTLFVAVLTALLFSLAGLLNGIFSKKFDDINLVPTFVLTPLTYFGGVFYSIELLSPFWQSITHLNPIFYMVSAFRYGMIGKADVSIGVSITVISILTILAYVANLWILKKGWGIKS